MNIQDLIGDSLEEEFLSFNLDEIVVVLSNLKNTDAIDLAHAELLQQQSLRGADILAEYLGKLVKTVSYLESKLSSVKNRGALEFMPKDGKAPSIELRKMAGEALPEVEELSIRLAKAKGAKVALEKKYDILLKSHYNWKEIAIGFRKSIGVI